MVEDKHLAGKFAKSLQLVPLDVGAVALAKLVEYVKLRFRRKGGK